MPGVSGFQRLLVEVQILVAIVLIGSISCFWGGGALSESPCSLKAWHIRVPVSQLLFTYRPRVKSS